MHILGDGIRGHAEPEMRATATREPGYEVPSEGRDVFWKVAMPPTHAGAAVSAHMRLREGAAQKAGVQAVRRQRHRREAGLGLDLALSLG